jgi:hypothetical protein
VTKLKPPKITFKDMWRQFAEHHVKPSPPSAQYDKARSCLSKKVHVTEAMAIAAAEKATREEGVPFVAYKCRWCVFHHVGHATKHFDLTKAKNMPR